MSSLRHVLVTSVPALTSDTHRSMRQCQQSLINRSPGAGAATHPWEMYCDVVVTTVQHSTAKYSTVQRPLYAISGLGTGWEEAEAAPPVAPHNPHIWAEGAVTPSLHRQYNQLGIGGRDLSQNTFHPISQNLIGWRYNIFYITSYILPICSMHYTYMNNNEQYFISNKEFYSNLLNKQ